MGVASVSRLLLPVLPALFFAWLVEWGCARQGFYPPGFRDPLRRWVARLSLGGVLYLGIFLPLGMIGTRVQEDLTAIPTPRLFLLHLLMLAALVLWMLAGYAGAESARRAEVSIANSSLLAPEPLPPAGGGTAEAAEPASSSLEASLEEIAPGDRVPGEAAVVVPTAAPEVGPIPAPAPAPSSLLRRIAAQLGLATPRVWREIGLGLALGVGAWAAVLLAIILVALLLFAVGGDKLLPKQPPGMVLFLAALPFGVRLLLSLSAGVVEEAFFRGFLQPRIGIFLSTALFALAHASYGQPFLLVGVSLLSLIYALLVRWRRTIWPAMVAHALFDGVQLLVVVPAVLKLTPAAGGAAKSVAALAGIG